MGVGSSCERNRFTETRSNTFQIDRQAKPIAYEGPLHKPSDSTWKLLKASLATVVGSMKNPFVSQNTSPKSPKNEGKDQPCKQVLDIPQVSACAPRPPPPQSPCLRLHQHSRGQALLSIGLECMRQFSWRLPKTHDFVAAKVIKKGQYML